MYTYVCIDMFIYEMCTLIVPKRLVMRSAKSCVYAYEISIYPIHVQILDT